jgi:hypothetical protein
LIDCSNRCVSMHRGGLWERGGWERREGGTPTTFSPWRSKARAVCKPIVGVTATARAGKSSSAFGAHPGTCEAKQPWLNQTSAVRSNSTARAPHVPRRALFPHDTRTAGSLCDGRQY